MISLLLNHYRWQQISISTHEGKTYATYFDDNSSSVVHHYQKKLQQQYTTGIGAPAT